MTTTLILVRHAQTGSNGATAEARMSGWTDAPLNGIGTRQAEQLSRRFQHEPRVAAIYSSPLMRARQTAGYLVHASDAPLQLLDDLREIHCGYVDGLAV